MSIWLQPGQTPRLCASGHCVLSILVKSAGRGQLFFWNRLPSVVSVHKRGYFFKIKARRFRKAQHIHNM